MVEFLFDEFVDRWDQVNNFQKILEGNLERPYFLFMIGGEGGIGKSFLLNQLLHMARHGRIARRDFQDVEVHTFLTIIHSAINDLGRDAFENTLADIDRVTLSRQHNVEYGSEIVHPAHIAYLDNLQQMLVDHFDLDELEDLYFKLNIKFDSLPGEGTLEKSRELLLYLISKHRLPDLAVVLRELRAEISWDEVFERDWFKIYGNGGKAESSTGSYFLPPADIQQQQSIAQQITSTFVGDLRSLAQDSPVILSFDTYEEASPLVQWWMTNSLLKELAQEQELRILVLIAGSKLPDEKELDILVNRRTAKTILKYFTLDHVREYWVERRQLSDIDVPAVFEETAGLPLKLAEKANEAGGKQLSYKPFVF